MSRLHFVVEGQTEETFVKNVLAPYLGQFNIFVNVRNVETSRSKTKIYRGGLIDYQKAKTDLQLWMRQEARNSDVYFTTMFDLYRLPDSFPAYHEAKRQSDPYQKVALLEKALAEELDYSRFMPYIQLHEFEALLFADIAKLDWEFLEHEREIASLVKLADEFGNPELIDDGPETAPSKRIIQLIPEYAARKVSVGSIVAQKIGVATLREKCLHFDQWLLQLEQLDKST